MKQTHHYRQHTFMHNSKKPTRLTVVVNGEVVFSFSMTASEWGFVEVKGPDISLVLEDDDDQPV